jgi:hypothetical protein
MNCDHQERRYALKVVGDGVEREIWIVEGVAWVTSAIHSNPAIGHAHFVATHESACGRFCCKSPGGGFGAPALRPRLKYHSAERRYLECDSSNNADRNQDSIR